MAYEPNNIQFTGSEDPLVSVCLITYNHVSYIRQALDSVLSQRTPFKFELCLGDDGSTDGTRQICEEYAAKHPEIIRLFNRSRDTVEYKFGVPTGNYNYWETIKSGKGKYIALLEGDDYWFDDDKLAKQVVFLEANPDHVLAGHLWLTDRGDSWALNAAMHFAGKTTQIDLGGFLQGLYMHTSTLMFRRPSQPPPEYFHQMYGRDHVTQVWHATMGKCAVLPWVGSVYRIHANGAWNGLACRLRLKAGLAETAIYSAVFPSYSRELKIRKWSLIRSALGAYIRGVIRIFRST